MRTLVGAAEPDEPVRYRSVTTTNGSTVSMTWLSSGLMADAGGRTVDTIVAVTGPATEMTTT